MALLTVPNSWGLLQEDNDCHKPAGSPEGGEFCSKPGGSGKIKVEIDDTPHPTGGLNARETLTQVFGAAAEEILTQLGQSFGGDVKIAVAVGSQTGALGIHIKDAAGNVITHQFIKGTGGAFTAKIPFFSVDKTQQNKGLAKKVLRDTMAVYERLGVQQVTLDANIDVGGYAWAKFGFTAMHPDDFRAQVLVNLLGPRGRMLETWERKDIVAFADKHKGPKLPWHIAGLSINGKKIGKTLMLGTDWEAVLAMDDPEARARFHTYVGE